MAPRYLNLSELAYVRWLASEALRWRRPRRAHRVRAFALAGPTPPRRPVDLGDLTLLGRVLEGLHRLEVSA